RVAPSGHPPVEMEVAGVYTAIGANFSSGIPKGISDSFGVQAVGPRVKRLTPNGSWGGRPPVFLGGDLVNDQRTVVDAIASGKAGAVAIDTGFRGLNPGKIWPSILVGGNGAVSVNCLDGGDRSRRQGHVVRYKELNTSYFFYQKRENPPSITFENRGADFHEVRMRVSGAMAAREATRCFRCGLCDQCDNCYLFCPDVSVRRDLNAGSREIDYDYCKGCGVCVAECPRNAMVLEEMPR
ncbi:MAG: hypothetical protein FIA93_03410, partial [Deltaproteobacteria bacterium]|nr:hypothetical protein [Deltaproteobacteria bacterium]